MRCEGVRCEGVGVWGVRVWDVRMRIIRAWVDVLHNQNIFRNLVSDLINRPHG